MLKDQKKIFNEADMILFVLNSSEKLSEEDKMIIDLLSSKKSIIILNKIDLKSNIEINHIEERFKDREIIKTSLVNDQGILDVENAIVNIIYKGNINNSDDNILSNSRHIDAIKSGLISIESAINATLNRMPYDFIEVDSIDCLDYLGKVTGETVENDIVKKDFWIFLFRKIVK